MCGIAGIFAYGDAAVQVEREELLRIREHMVKRGPDGAGLWISADGRIGLAHRRLSIIDLSEAGAQPMTTMDGRLTITFNGEIYNYRELRKDLEATGYRFRTNSDTEVLLHLYAERGEDMVHSLRGMFAFGIWDSRDQSLFLARDPFGIKPLYYADDGNCFRFASQVKALLKGGAIATAPDPAGSVGFLIWGAVPEPFSLYRAIQALPAGTRLRVRRGHGGGPNAYFCVRDELVRAQSASPFEQSRAREVLAEALRDTVRHHLVSDVPVGVFLSSGLDSSTLAGLAVEQCAGQLHTLTLGFREYQGTANDEVPLAEGVAAQYGTRHETHWITRENFDADRERILEAMDQPSTDGVNTWFVSKAAAEAGMKVALSGLGGDEIFGGYPSFNQVPRIASWLRLAGEAPALGRAVRRIAAPLLGRIASPKMAGLLEYGGTFGGAYLLRRALFMPWELGAVLDPVALQVGLARLRTLPLLEASIAGVPAPHARIAALELTWYMRNQLLRDADWAGMAHSLEIRVPLVDTELFRAVAPWLVSANPPKKADAAAALRRPLPDPILRRPKSGFSVPVRRWLAEGSGEGLDRASGGARGLRGWARRLLPQQPRQFRALVLVTDAFGGHGGIAKFNRDFISSIAAMPECAEVVAIPRLMPAQPGKIPAGVTFHGAAAGAKAHFLRAGLRQLRGGPYDLVVAGHINLAPLAVVLAQAKRARTALIIHGIDAWTRHGSALVRACLPCFDRVFGVSSVTLDRFRKWSRVSEARFRVLPNCVDLGQFAPGPRSSELARRLGVEGRRVIMTLGRLSADERYKGFDEVMEALPELAKAIPDIIYLICGDGPDRLRLEAKATALGVGDRVRFAGFIDERQKADYYRLADAYVMPGRGEGFGIVYLEALACGLPTLGSMLDGSREALLEGRLGELVDPNDPDALRTAILRTLARERRVPDDLKVYSTEAYKERVAAFVREALGYPPARTG